jgi:hypothetical protein
MSKLTENEQKFIKFVNPSFQKFDRPFLLSIVVFIIVHSFVVGITVALTQICPENIIVVDKFQFFSSYDLLRVSCVKWTAELANDSVGSC